MGASPSARGKRGGAERRFPSLFPASGGTLAPWQRVAAAGAGKAGTPFPGKRWPGSGGREGPSRGGKEQGGGGRCLALPGSRSAPPGPALQPGTGGDGEEREKLTKPTQGSARNGGEGEGKGFLPLQHPLGEKWGNVLFV